MHLANYSNHIIPQKSKELEIFFEYFKALDAEETLGVQSKATWRFLMSCKRGKLVLPPINSMIDWLIMLMWKFLIIDMLHA